MSIASQPLPGAVAVEEHNDVDHTSVSLAVSTVDSGPAPQDNEPTRPCGCRWFAASASPTKGPVGASWRSAQPESFPRRGSGFDLEARNQPQPGYLEQLYAFGDVLRTPGRVPPALWASPNRHPVLITSA